MFTNHYERFNFFARDKGIWDCVQGGPITPITLEHATHDKLHCLSLYTTVDWRSNDDSIASTRKDNRNIVANEYMHVKCSHTSLFMCSLSVSQSLSSEAVAWICQWLHRTVSTADLYPLIMSASQLPCVWSGVKSHRDTDITLEWLHNYARGRFMGTAIYLLPCKPNHAVFCMHIAWCFYAQRQRELYEDVKFSVEYVSYLPHTYSFYNDVHIHCKV